MFPKVLMALMSKGLIECAKIEPDVTKIDIKKKQDLKIRSAHSS